MFESIGRSWNLMKQSFSVLKSDKELVVFPILSGVLSILALIAFFVPLLLAGFFDNELVLYAVIFCFYFASSFIVIFFNSALIGAANIRLNGGDPTLSDGFMIAFSRLTSIAGWAFISATVGLILRILAGKNRNNIIGQIIIGLVGGAWSVITFFVIPVLVIEGVDPLTAIKRSTDIVKNKFGEMMIGGLGFGLIFGLGGAFGVIALAGITIVLGGVLGLAGWIAGGMLILAFLVCLGILSSALNGIFVAALYHYATTGQDSSNFKVSEMIATAQEQQTRTGLF
ncbi:hypothetical protein HY992_01690 [Candidatus Micrarchaeota archaeon]|nr:hypothetical protein [Candidatus Micrarchaeota archaeon]